MFCTTLSLVYPFSGEYVEIYSEGVKRVRDGQADEEAFGGKILVSVGAVAASGNVDNSLVTKSGSHVGKTCRESSIKDVPRESFVVSVIRPVIMTSHSRKKEEGNKKDELHFHGQRVVVLLFVPEF